MSTFTTALGEVYTVERRLPQIGWRPSWRGTTDPSDAAFLDVGDADGILAAIALLFLVIALVVIVLPLLLFVAEVALLIALVIPLTVIAIAVGVVTHTVQVRRGGKDGEVVDQRQVRGVISSWQAARALRSAAESGSYRVRSTASSPSGAAWP